MYEAGTCYNIRVGMHPDLEKKNATIKEPGDYIFVRGDSNLVCATVKDSGPVCAISSRHDRV